MNYVVTWCSGAAVSTREENGEREGETGQQTEERGRTTV
jgi:hypothetical protein